MRNVKNRKKSPGDPTAEPLFQPETIQTRAEAVPFWARALFTGLTGLLGLAILVLAGYGAYRLMETEPPAPSSASSPSESETDAPSSISQLPPTQQEPVVIGPDLNLVVERGSESSEVNLTAADGKTPLTSEEIVHNILPSIVGITSYAKDVSEPLATGSGFVLSEDGYLVTCAHLVENAARINVVLSNNKQQTAELVGLDAQTDLAVLKINASSLIPVRFGQSDTLSPGVSVLAVGNPGGATFTGSITDGVLSSPSRSVKIRQNAYYTMDALQITAVVDPGNNGGPLCDVYGNVIGVCSSEQKSDEFPSAFFAIPSSVVVSVAEDLVQYGRVTGRVWLGIGAVALNETTAKLNGLPSGVMVTTIYEGSNVADAGLQPNDIIITIDGKVMNSLDALRSFLDDHSPGDLVTLTVFRRGETSAVVGSETESSEDGSQSESSSGVYDNGYMLQIYLYLLEDTGSLIGAFVPE